MERFEDRLSLKTLLEHFSEIEDEREGWRVAYPLSEVLFLVVCGTLAACDDFGDIALWGEEHIDFLRNFLPYDHGVPCGRWLNILMNRIDPALFSACFMNWASGLRPDAAEIIAVDGKTSRRSHDKGHGRIETRTALVCKDVSWMSRERPCPGEYRFPSLACLVRVHSQVEEKGRRREEIRYYICSRALSAEEALNAVRAHWRIENSLHWGHGRDLQGRPLPRPKRPRRSKYGHRQTFRLQPHPPCKRQTQPQKT